MSTALAGLRVCDLTGQLAGAGATRFLAAFGAQVIRVEDPVRKGTWDILRGAPPFKGEQRGIDAGGAFNNHNVEKLGVTINLRDERGRDLFRRLVAVSDVVAENFAAGVMERLGCSYTELRAIRPEIVYVSNSGFGATGPYSAFKSWGPVVQACCGLTSLSGLPGLPPAGIGYSYMDHHGGNFMAMAILAAIVYRNRTGKGQWIDMSCTDAGALLSGPALFGESEEAAPGRIHSNRSDSPPMAPHGVYPTAGDDNWIAIACRDDADWARMRDVVDELWAHDERFGTLAGRLAGQDELDLMLVSWTAGRERQDLWDALQGAGVPAAAVQRPSERVDSDPATLAWGLWPTVRHSTMGQVRVEGLPLRLSATDWVIERGAPCLGEHNVPVFRDLLGVRAEELRVLRQDGVV